MASLNLHYTSTFPRPLMWLVVEVVISTSPLPLLVESSGSSRGKIMSTTDRAISITNIWLKGHHHLQIKCNPRLTETVGNFKGNTLTHLYYMYTVTMER